MKLKRVRSVPLHNYGLPYKGSKNKIARWVLSYLPAGGTLYDLFCGGCAVTHAAILLDQGKIEIENYKQTNKDIHKAEEYFIKVI